MSALDNIYILGQVWILDAFELLEAADHHIGRKQVDFDFAMFCNG